MSLQTTTTFIIYYHDYTINAIDRIAIKKTNDHFLSDLKEGKSLFLVNFFKCKYRTVIFFCFQQKTKEIKLLNINNLTMKCSFNSYKLSRIYKTNS
jgi:hypothetical protein